MKCSELITKLSEHISKYGDGNIWFTLEEMENEYKKIYNLELRFAYRSEVMAYNPLPVGFGIVFIKMEFQDMMMRIRK